jgi:pimeloyl-ACP methyl ester carboxylesterase
MHIARSKDGTPIAYDRLGEGPPLILVQGAMNDLSLMLPLAAQLQADFTVFPYDRRGRGASGDTHPYAVEREIEDLEVILDAAGGSAFVFGNCSGGALVLESVARGLPITKLALYEPPFIIPGTRAPLPPDYKAHLAELISAELRDEAIEYFTTAAVGLPAEVLVDVRDGAMWPSLIAMAPTLVYDDAVMGDCSVPTELLASITLPALVMDGAESPGWAKSSVQALVNALPNSYHYSLPGQDHHLVAEAVAPVLREFLQRAEERPEASLTV